MNTCKCEICLGKACHYSAYYHREEGFDAMHNKMRADFDELVLRLEDELHRLRTELYLG